MFESRQKKKLQYGLTRSLVSALLPDTVYVPFLEELAPKGFFYGGQYIVEFDPNSLWYETSLTMAALALRQGIKTEYHVFQHFPDEAREALSKLRIDVVTCEKQGLLKIVDSFTATLDYEKKKKKGEKSDPFATPGGPLDVVRGVKNWVNAAKAGYSDLDKRWLHIDDNTSIFLQYNDEETLVDCWRIGLLPFGVRARETPHFLSWVKGTASAAFYTKFEAMCDGVIDLETREEGGKINNYLRLRMLRGRNFDSRWHRIELSSTGEVKLLGASSETEQRKLAAIMFTDIVGYTAVSQRDESLALRLLDRHRELVRPIFSKFNGSEVKTIGDAFLVEFASALEAAKCAIEIQKELSEANRIAKHVEKIELRIGVHLGDVIHRGNDVYGDAVNIASRIEPLAEPGGICVSQQVYDHILNKFEFPLKTMGPRDLKNVEFPIEVYRVILPWRQEAREASDAKVEMDKLRVAVLPLSSLSPDPNDEYFADGMTEELISTISNIHGLGVVSRTSVMQYKNVSRKMLTIGQELNAGSVLEGSVRKAGNRVRIAVQLIDVENDRHLWAENYDRELEDVFAIQSDISRKVAESLEIRLLGNDKERIEKPKTASAEAHTLYLKGRYYWNERNEESLRKALDYFRLATEKDPNYALAYSGMADCYTVLADFGLLSANEAFSKASEASLKALRTDPDLAEAHASYGNSLEGLWEFKAAEREFKSAIALNPNYATAHQWYALHLERMCRFDEAISEIEKARELDPLSPQIRSNTALAYISKGDYDEAISRLKALLAIEPNFGPAQVWLITAYSAKGMNREALEEIRSGAISNQSAVRWSMFATAYAKAGMQKEAEEIILRLQERSKKEYVDPVLFASIYSSLGMKDEAFDWLERAYEKRSQFLMYLQIYPWFEGVRSDKRYLDLIKRIGFP